MLYGTGPRSPVPSVFISHRRWLRHWFLACICGLSSLVNSQGASFLFDNTKAQTAGNADWVIDQEASGAARFPTPAAASITAATLENYWTGGISAWGIALVQRGHSVETLPAGSRITYRDPTNPQDLSNYQVFVVVEPNVLFTTVEKAAIVTYVLEGGRIFIIGNHSGSDRNNDGADPVQVWNDLFANNGVMQDPFGFSFNTSSIWLTSTLIENSATNPLTRGIAGAVTQLRYSAGATMSIRPVSNPSVRAAVWTSSVSDSTVMATYGNLGLGRFAALGDSSPSDDGSGMPGDTLYPGWTEIPSHASLILNASLWLAAPTAPANDAFANAPAIANPQGSISLTGSSISATTEVGEPSHALSPSTSNSSVWWKFTAASDATATLTTAGSSFDTQLAVYTGSLLADLDAVAKNDDASDTVKTSVVSFPTIAGTTYWIAVAGNQTGRIALQLDLPILPRPGNDDFSQASEFPSSGGSVITHNSQTTAEAGEPLHAGRSGSSSVWWRWTAPLDAQSVTISTRDSSIDTNLAIYTGDSVEALTPRAADTDSFGTLTSGLRLDVLPGATYRIAVAGDSGAIGSIRLSLSPSSQKSVRPENDAFQAPVTLVGFNANVSTVSDYASSEPGEPAHAGQAAAKSLWWTWTATSSGQTTIHTAGSNFDTTLAVYTGTTLAGLVSIAANDNTGDATSRVVFNAVAGTSYRIAVAGSRGASGAVRLAVAGNPFPVNDRFVNALPLVMEDLKVTTSATNESATKEASEPNHAGFSGGKSVWWKFTPSVSGFYSVDTFGSNFDTLLGLYSGTRVSGLTTIASNDDSAGRQSYIAAQLTAGFSYTIAVDGYGANSGVILLNLARVPPPANDAFATPFTLSAETNSMTGQNSSATAEIGEPAHAGRPASRSLWWTWTAPADGFAALSTAGSAINTTLAVYQGSSLTALTLVAANDDANATLQSQVSFAVTAGSGYRIAVDSFAATSAGSIRIALNPVLPAPVFSFIKYTDAAERGLVPGRFDVTINPAQPSAVTVAVQMRGSATAEADYTSTLPISAGVMQVSFAPLQIVAPVAITPLADSLFLEFDEIISPTLPSGVVANLLLRDDTPYTAAWLAAIGPSFTESLAHPDADVDADGSTNFLEFALGGNPISGPPTAHAPVLSSSVFTDTDGQPRAFATLSFLRRRSSTLVYEVQGSSDLQTWSSTGLPLLLTSTQGVAAGYERVLFRSTIPIEQGPRFLRVVVTWP